MNLNYAGCDQICPSLYPSKVSLLLTVHHDHTPSQEIAKRAWCLLKCKTKFSREVCYVPSNSFDLCSKYSPKALKGSLGLRIRSELFKPT
jgi:hypothetical protein